MVVLHVVLENTWGETVPTDTRFLIGIRGHSIGAGAILNAPIRSSKYQGE
jgi:hypothetical protein